MKLPERDLVAPATRRRTAGSAHLRTILAALEGHEPRIGTSRAPVVSLQRDVLDQATCIGQLEARGNGFAAALQETEPLTELSTDHQTFLFSHGARGGAFYAVILGVRG
jgi:hypothetical protein